MFSDKEPRLERERRGVTVKTLGMFIVFTLKFLSVKILHISTDGW